MRRTTTGYFLTLDASCCFSLKSEAEQMRRKLNHQAKADQHAGEVRSQPAWIVHNFKQGAVIVRVEVRLIEGLAAIAQRVVHINLHLAIFTGLSILYSHSTCIVLGNRGAGVNLVGEFEKLDAEWFVITPLTQNHFV